MAKTITIETKKWMQGYVCACAVILQEHGSDVEVKDCLGNVYHSIKDLKRYEVDEHDIKILMPILKELDRKKALNKKINKSHE